MAEAGKADDVGTLVPDPILMVQVFAELRYGVVVLHTRETV